MATPETYRSVEDASLPIMQDVFGPILNRGVEISLANIDQASYATVKANYTEPSVLVTATLTGGVQGTIYFLYSQMLAAAITDLMVMGDGDAPFNEQESLDGVSEATNQIVGALCTFYSQNLPAEVRIEDLKGELVDIDEGLIDFEQFLQMDFKLSIQDFGDQVFTKLVPVEMTDKLLPVAGDPAISQAQQQQQQQEPQQQQAPPQQPAPGAGQQQQAPPQGAGAGFGTPPPGMGPGTQPPPGGMQAPQNVQPASFAQFDVAEAMAQADEPQNLDLLLDINLPVTIELGRTHMLIRDILEIGPGSVIELNKLSGEPVDLYVNDKKFAMGEVVVIDENFGIRITELLREEDRMQALKP
ncbi:flagellar motor switch protein FliN [bacterium]|nr:flagellar motor switch protein FliN [bacterium]